MPAAKRSTAEKIAEDVISHIRSGKLKPGDRVREQELASRFKTSRGPVREALRILDSKFWVTLEPGKGARVVELDDEVYPDAGFIGQALSGVTARFAAARATKEEQDEIDRLARDLAKIALTDISPEAFSEHTWRLGAYVTKVARSPRLEKLIASFQKGGLVKIAYDGVQLRSQRIAAARLWLDVAIAIRLRDGTQAEAVMRQVIGRSMQAVMRSAIHPAIWQDHGNG